MQHNRGGGVDPSKMRDQISRKLTLTDGASLQECGVGVAADG